MSTALDEFVDLVRAGMPKGSVGVRRETEVCGHCEDRLFDGGSFPGLKVCPICNIWLHSVSPARRDPSQIGKRRKSCYAVHMANHMVGVVSRGLRKKQKAKEASIRMNEQRLAEVGKATRIEPTDVPSPVPAVVADPLLDEFYLSRTRYTGEDLRKKRSNLRSDTSDEEWRRQPCTAASADPMTTSSGRIYA